MREIPQPTAIAERIFRIAPGIRSVEFGWPS